ncbi:MAG: hypothetical protein V8S69_05260 [Dakarella massiliensis]
MPGVRHLNGSIAANPETGMVKAWGENGEASFPGIFPDPRIRSGSFRHGILVCLSEA